LETKKDSKIFKRGALVKSISIVSKSIFGLYSLTEYLKITLQYLYENPEMDLDTCFTNLLQSMNEIDLSNIRKYSDWEIYYNRYCVNNNSILKIPKIQTKYLEKEININIKNDLASMEFIDKRVSILKLIERFKSKTMIIINSILCQKRILFCGYEKSAGEVSTLILSLPNLFRHSRFLLYKKIFPYASLGNLDFLLVKGYIAGLTNPIVIDKTVKI
jgi:hypothetical protein